MSQERVQKLIERASRVVESAQQRGADVAEVLARDSQELSVKVRLGERELVEEAGSSAVGLRVIKHGRGAITYTSDVTEGGLARVVSDALELAALSEPDEDAVPPDPSELMREAPMDLDLHDPSGANIDGAKATEWALAGEQAARDFDPKITNSDGGTFGRTWGATALVTSGGFAAGYEGTYQSVYVSPIADDADGKKRNGYYWDARRHVAAMSDPAEVGREAARRTLAKLGARKVPTCEVPVIFDPDAGRALLGLLFGVFVRRRHLSTAQLSRRRDGSVHRVRPRQHRGRPAAAGRPRLSPLRRRRLGQPAEPSRRKRSTKNLPPRYLQRAKTGGSRVRPAPPAVSAVDRPLRRPTFICSRARPRPTS